MRPFPVILALYLFPPVHTLAQVETCSCPWERTARQAETLMRIPEWHPSVGTRAGEELPVGVDNSRQPFFPPVFSQRGGSCSQASAVRYAFTYEYNRMRGIKADDPSRIFSYHYTWNYLNEGTGEGSFPEEGYRLMRTIGAMTLQQMNDEDYAVSSTTWMTGYDAYLQAFRRRVKEYYRFNLKTAEGIGLLKHYLAHHSDSAGSPTESEAAGGVATFSCNSTGWQMETYSGSSVTGLSHLITSNGSGGGHALTICGYDDSVGFDLNGDSLISEEEKGAFLIVNSWGTAWASRGRCYYPYLLFLKPSGEGGLSESDAQALCVVTEEHEPLVVFECDLTYDSRNDLQFTLGVAEDAETDTPDHTFTYPAMECQGGDYGMRGGNSTEACTINVALDFTDMLPFFANCDKPRFFLDVRRIAIGEKVGKGRVNTFRVHDYRRDTTYICHQTPFALDKGRHLLRTDSPRPNPQSIYEWCYDNGEPKNAPMQLLDAKGMLHKIKFRKDGVIYVEEQ